MKVKPHQGNYCYLKEHIINIEIPIMNETIFDQNCYRTNLIDNGISLVIFPRFKELDEGTLASAGSRFIDSNGRPTIGICNVGNNIVFSLAHTKEYLESILLHEFMHVLGFSGYNIINYFPNNSYYSMTDSEGSHFFVTSPKMIEKAKKYFSCDSITKIEFENQGGEGTVGSHWEARYMLGDIMNGVIYPPEQVISEMTLALFEDSGWYKPNYYTGGLMRYGKHQGCEFLTEKCVDQTTHKTKFKNDFWDEIYLDLPENPGCTSGRLGRGYAIYGKYSQDLPTYYQYFSQPNYGGFHSSANYCPTFYDIDIIGYPRENHYLANCQKGDGDFGLLTFYRYSDTQLGNGISNGELPSDFGEVYGDNSFCSLTTLIPESSNTDIKNKYEDFPRAFCYPMYCSDRSLTIQINNDFIVCPRSGGKVKMEGYIGFVLCPDYNLICTGTVMCNDLFDCVDKKSEPKIDNYDYIIKTSQKLSEEMDDSKSPVIVAYELSENGKCEKGCAHCTSSECKKY